MKLFKVPTWLNVLMAVVWLPAVVVGVVVGYAVIGYRGGKAWIETGD